MCCSNSRNESSFIGSSYIFQFFSIFITISIVGAKSEKCFCFQLIIALLTVAAVSYGTPLQPEEDLELEDLVSRQPAPSPLVTEEDAAAPDELQRSRRSIHGQYFSSKTEIYLHSILATLLFQWLFL